MKKETKMRSMFDSTVKRAGEGADAKAVPTPEEEYTIFTSKMSKKTHTRLKIFAVKGKPMWECIEEAVIEYMDKNK